jgi:hypothetical protein
MDGLAQRLVVGLDDATIAALARGLDDELLARLVRGVLVEGAPEPTSAPKVAEKPAPKVAEKPVPKASRNVKPETPQHKPPGVDEVIAALADGERLGVKDIARLSGLDTGRAGRAVVWLAARGRLASEGTRGTRACRWRLA